MIEDEKEMRVLKAIEDFYERQAPIQEIPPKTDLEVMLELLTVTQDTSLFERAHGLEAQELLADEEALLSVNPGAPAPVDAPAGPARLDSAAAAAHLPPPSQQGWDFLKDKYEEVIDKTGEKILVDKTAQKYKLDASGNIVNGPPSAADEKPKSNGFAALFLSLIHISEPTRPY